MQVERVKMCVGLQRHAYNMCTHQPHTPEEHMYTTKSLLLSLLHQTAIESLKVCSLPPLSPPPGHVNSMDYTTSHYFFLYYTNQTAIESLKVCSLPLPFSPPLPGHVNSMDDRPRLIRSILLFSFFHYSQKKRPFILSFSPLFSFSKNNII